MEEEQQFFNLLENQLKEAIQDSLSNHLYQNASFLAERLFAEKDSEETRSILSDCYFSENKPSKAYHILKDCRSDQNRYKLALACLKINSLKEAEKVLLMGYDFAASQQKVNQANLQIENVPNGSYGFYLLGLINERQQRYNEAKEFFMKAIDLNPNLWCAMGKICKLGEQFNPLKLFSEHKFAQFETQKKSTLSELQKKCNNFTVNNENNNQFTLQSLQQQLIAGKIVGKKNKEKSQGTPLQQSKQNQLPGSSSKNQEEEYFQKQFDEDFSEQINQKDAFSTFQANKPKVAPKIMNFAQQNTTTTNSLMSNFTINLEESHNYTQNLKKSNHNFQQLLQFKAQQNVPKKPSTATFPQHQQETLQFKDISQLLSRFAEPYYNFSQYNCQQAIEGFQKLPFNHYNTGYVLNLIGRCYMEIVRYHEAEKYFQEAQKVEPYRLEGIEYYSSCLWQLKKPVELCYLAHFALEKNIFSPETWIAVGNSFSLQKEHENALKFFNRAIQLNPYNPYAHSLCGHEYVYNEDFTKARKYFEAALHLDVRHYNAWWGLGNIFYKQEKYDRAAENFNRAIQINPRNPVLYSFQGMTHTAKHEFIEALKFFDHSENLDPTNGLNRYQKANVLVKLEQNDQALVELDKLQRLMPKEAPIPMLMGKIYKKLQQIDKAHYYFTLALDLETKDTQRIKAFIESLHNHSNEFTDDLDL